MINQMQFVGSGFAVGVGVGVDLGFGLGLVSDGGVGGGTATVLLLESFKIQTFYNPIFRPFMIIFT